MCAPRVIATASLPGKTWPCTRGARRQKFAGAGTRNEFRPQPPSIKHHAGHPCDQPRPAPPLEAGQLGPRPAATARSIVQAWPSATPRSNALSVELTKTRTRWSGVRIMMRAHDPQPRWASCQAGGLSPVCHRETGQSSGCYACRSATWSCTRIPAWRRTGSGSRTLSGRSPRRSSSRPSPPSASTRSTPDLAGGPRYL